MKLIIIGFGFWLLETAYFGFNFEPCCSAERVCDRIAVGLVLFGTIKIFIAKEVQEALKENNG